MFEPAPSAVVANRYRLVREIGRGGMGAVWEAFDLELEARCALKFILNQERKPADVRARFLREARAVARLQSPHVVSVRSVGEWEGALFIAMELLIGETLFERLGRTGTLSAHDTARLVDQVASVLAIAHAAGIVHRDLKPENIWLWSQGELLVKVLDFGVAKHVFDDGTLLKTATGVLVGTPYYMSPEQAAGDRQVDHRSDLWSLAIIAAECLSGQRPFQGTGLGQVLASIINGAPPDITKLYSGSNPALQAWWARSTAKEPGARHDSAPALARELAWALGVGGGPTRRTAAPVATTDATDSDNATAPDNADKPPAATSSLSPIVTGASATQPLENTADVWNPAASDRVATATRSADASNPAVRSAQTSDDASVSPFGSAPSTTQASTDAGAPYAKRAPSTAAAAGPSATAARASTDVGSGAATPSRRGRLIVAATAAVALALVGVSLGRSHSPDTDTSNATLPSTANPVTLETAASRTTADTAADTAAARGAVGTAVERATPIAAPTAASSVLPPLTPAPRAATTAVRPAPTPKPKTQPAPSAIDRRIGF